MQKFMELTVLAAPALQILNKLKHKVKVVEFGNSTTFLS
ncbi:Uncharacterised protein [Streptococcus criceti]|nr:Uncharacterised protein [Streptococcus criceti]